MSEAMLEAMLDEQARACVIREVKRVARRYALAPRFLDAIEPGLSQLYPRMLAARTKHLFQDACGRRFSYRSMHNVINLRSAMLYGRHLRFVAHIHRRRR